MLQRIIKCLVTVLLLAACSKSDREFYYGPDSSATSAVANQWADMTLQTVMFAQPNTPTYTSRSLAYMGIAMYESVVAGSPDQKSLAGQLSQLNTLPPPAAGVKYDWVLTLNAGQATMLRKLYPNSPMGIRQMVDSLENLILVQEKSKTNDQAMIDRSIDLGILIATHIFEWSLTDGGANGQSTVFDPNYQYPSGPGLWIPPPPGGQSPVAFPMHPYWGNNRNFVPSNTTVEIPAIMPYSTDTASEDYKEFLEVYQLNKSLTQADKETALWWSDDPTQSYAPPGHSYNIASIAIKKSNASLFVAAEAYARTGIAVADAFIDCWRTKYTYHSQRPYPYIHTFIDTNYVQFWPEPPFPAFTSGHSTQAAAMATALAGLFGENFSLTDNTNVFRVKDYLRDIDFKPRSYNSLWQTAEDCGYSRLLGGIHTRQDNEKGLAMGKQIGENVNALQWRK